MTKLVFVTQTLDPGHAALAQTLDLVEALAERVDELVVLCQGDRWGAAPANAVVRSYGASSKVGRAFAYERQLAASLGGADAVLAHMVPTFLTLAAPLAKPRRIPLLLWYTHWHAGLSLRVATVLCDAALSVDVSSYPIRSPKVHGIGHAIDVAMFAATPVMAHDGPVRFLVPGRTARWKGLATLLEAFALAVGNGLDATLEIRGPSLTADERGHRAELAAAIAADPRLGGRVRIEEPVVRALIPALLGACDVVVNPVEPSSGAALDKAVYEAAACARPVVSTNAALRPFLSDVPLSLLAPPRDPQALAAVLLGVGAAAPELRAAVGAELRRRVVSSHSLDHWADAVLAVIGDLRSTVREPRAKRMR